MNVVTIVRGAKFAAVVLAGLLIAGCAKQQVDQTAAMAGAAPKAMKAGDMTPETLDWGVTAGIVPGNLGGYIAALERFGSMSLADVFAPGIDYAEHGYPIDPSLAAAISRAKSNLEKFPTTAKVFLPNGRAPDAGALFRNPDLAATLRKVVEAEQPRTRLNDAKCDRRGRFFAGGSDDKEDFKICGFYTLDPDLRVTKVDDGIICTNGPCWSPDDRTFSLADTFQHE